MKSAKKSSPKKKPTKKVASSKKAAKPVLKAKAKKAAPAKLKTTAKKAAVSKPKAVAQKALKTVIKKLKSVAKKVKAPAKAPVKAARAKVGATTKKVATANKKNKATKKVAAPKFKKQAPRIGIFGGSFDPFHQGHLNSMLTVLERMKLEQILVVPAAQSPLRQLIQGSDAKHRLEMVQLGIKDHTDKLAVDQRELSRGGVSYTIDTILELREERKDVEFSLIIGMDQLAKFDLWRDFAYILNEVDLIVTSRPGYEVPKHAGDFPQGMQQLIRNYAGTRAELMSGRRISFVQLEDVDVSATEVRKRLRDKLNVEGVIPNSVAEYIARENLYENVAKSIGDFERFTLQCGQWLKGKGGINVRAYDLRALVAPAEFTLIASGTSTRHTSALAEFISREVKKELGVWPQGVEGMNEGRWVVLDYGSLIIHVFYDYARQEYRLEQLWNKGKEMSWPAEAPRVMPNAQVEKTAAKTE